MVLASLGGTVAYASVTFSDVPDSHPFVNEIGWMAENGIAEGYPDGTYKPANAVSRQATATLLYRVAGAPRGADPECTVGEFTDIPAGSIEYLTIFAVGFTLFVLTLLLNIVSIRLVRKYRQVYE